MPRHHGNMHYPPNFRIACKENLHSISSKANISCLWRSGNLNRIDDATALMMVGELGIQTNIDLRSHEEVKNDGVPCKLMKRGVAWQHFPLSQETSVLRENKFPNAIDYFEYYDSLLLENQEMIKQLMEHISHANQQRFIINCHAGKDRTGVVVMLLMSAIGIEAKAILGDYHMSRQYLIRDIDYFECHWKKKGISKAQYAMRLECDILSMRKLMHKIMQNYGSINKYLYHLGIEKQCVDKIKSKFYVYGDLS